ncbi:MAG: pentapeptide repeat-containing protein [Actinomycetota bacterium]
MPEFPSGLDLSGHDLSGADLRHANLTGHNLSRADLTGADLRGANLSGVNLSEANLSRANLMGASLAGTNLTGATSTGTIWPEGFTPEPVSGTSELGPTYTVMIEGTLYAWAARTISVPEIRTLAGFPAGQPVIQVELAGGEDYGPVAERPLREDDVHELVPLEPGKGVVKHMEFRRS